LIFTRELLPTYIGTNMVHSKPELVPPSLSLKLFLCRSDDIAWIAAGDWIRPALEFENFSVGKPKSGQRQVCILQHALVIAGLAVSLCALAPANCAVMILPVRIRSSIAVKKIARYNIPDFGIRRQVGAGVFRCHFRSFVQFPLPHPLAPTILGSVIFNYGTAQK
jgi:hypothetical protein